MLGLTGPAYLWLAVAVFLPLSAMLYFSFLTVAPFGGREAAVTLKHYPMGWCSSSPGCTASAGCRRTVTGDESRVRMSVSDP